MFSRDIFLFGVTASNITKVPAGDRAGKLAFVAFDSGFRYGRRLSRAKGIFRKYIGF